MSFPVLPVPLFFALDVDDDVTAFKLAKETQGKVGGFKIGPRLVYRYGSQFVKKLAELGPVFVDNKYHDIPSVMVASLRASFESGASFATIHASAGQVAMRECALFEAEAQKSRPFRVLAVTVLTSFSESTLPSNWQSMPIDRHVQVLAKGIFASGLTGVVCSPFEVKALRAEFPSGYFVTPGVRLPDEPREDQVRVMSPQEALAAGSSALVMGRSIMKYGVPAL